MKKRIYQNEVDDIDRGLLPGLHHVNWKDKGESKDHTRYGVGGKVVKHMKEKNIHKGLV